MVRWGRGIGGGPSAGFLQYVPAWVVLAVCLAAVLAFAYGLSKVCLLYTSPSPRD